MRRTAIPPQVQLGIPSLKRQTIHKQISMVARRVTRPLAR